MLNGQYVNGAVLALLYQVKKFRALIRVGNGLEIHEATRISFTDMLISGTEIAR